MRYYDKDGEEVTLDDVAEPCDETEEERDARELRETDEATERWLRAGWMREARRIR